MDWLSRHEQSDLVGKDKPVPQHIKIQNKK